MAPSMANFKSCEENSPLTIPLPVDREGRFLLLEDCLDESGALFDAVLHIHFEPARHDRDDSVVANRRNGNSATVYVHTPSYAGSPNQVENVARLRCGQRRLHCSSALIETSHDCFPGYATSTGREHHRHRETVATTSYSRRFRATISRMSGPILQACSQY